MADTQSIKEMNEQAKPTPIVKAPADFTDPEILYKELIDSIRKYHPSDDISLIEKAYQTAKKHHKDQRRRSGEPYIIHPICVGIILAELELDKESIIAGLLHDIVEDTEMTLDDVTREFGEEVALLVDGVTKLTQIKWNKDKVEIQAENLRKMFLAMAKDIRVILIKLADRLHNMRTMQYMPPEKQKEKSRETMEIFAPIASRLGISKIKVELDDLALMYLEPEVYHELTTQLALTESAREDYIKQIKQEVSERLKEAGIEAKIEGRVKHLFSIYKKMVNQNKTLEQIYDVFAVRILVDSVRDCYAVLGIIHGMYHPVPNRFKDYIAMPKLNNYQSLHNTMMGTNGQPFEIQIRTYDMHRIAEYGIAAHWKYKEQGSGKSTLKSEEKKMNWLRRILEWQKDMNDNKEFLSALKDDFDLFSEEVYCFSPKGDLKTLPKGATPIDFAYSIHSAVGNKMVGARVNKKMVPIDYELQNGDRVEIMMSQNVKGPSRDWLKIVKSAQARTKINQWFKAEKKEENIVKGREMIAVYCKTKRIQLNDLLKPELQEKVMLKYGFKDWDAVLAAVGHGGLREGQVVNKLTEEYDKLNQHQILNDEEIINNINEEKKEQSSVGGKHCVIVKGTEDMSVRFSKCCSPVPGDEIIGYITRGRGTSIHRTDCTNIIALPESERVRLVPAEWQPGSLDSRDEKFQVEIRMFCNDKVGMINNITKVLADNSINITSINSKNGKQNIATIIVRFYITGMEQLNYVMNRVSAIDGVLDIERSIG